MKVPYGEKEALETGWTCPYCGEDIAWWLEPYEKVNGRIFHEKCLAQEHDDYDRENTNANHEPG